MLISEAAVGVVPQEAKPCKSAGITRVYPDFLQVCMYKERRFSFGAERARANFSAVVLLCNLCVRDRMFISLDVEGVRVACGG